jgi:ParB family chromosome partitioning protein
MRDLFEADDGGWLQDPTLLDRLVMEKLAGAADDIRAEGWKWVETALSFPGDTHGTSRRSTVCRLCSEEEAARLTALHSEQEAIEAEYAQADEFPKTSIPGWARSSRLLRRWKNALCPSIRRTWSGRGLCQSGYRRHVAGRTGLRSARGYAGGARGWSMSPRDMMTRSSITARVTMSKELGRKAPPTPSPKKKTGKPLSDRLLTELTAWRTLALRMRSPAIRTSR